MRERLRSPRLHSGQREPGTWTREAGMKEGVTGKDVYQCAIPAKPLLAKLEERRRDVLVDADLWVEDDPIPEPAERHREIGVLAVHPVDDSSHLPRDRSAECHIGTRNAADSVDRLQRPPTEAEPPQALELAHAVEPGPTGRRQIERADHTYQGILKPAGRERERVEADLDVGVDPDHQLVVALPQRSVQGGRLAGVGDGRHLSGCR